MSGGLNVMTLDFRAESVYDKSVDVCGQPYAILANGNLGGPSGNVGSEVYMMKLGWQPADAQLGWDDTRSWVLIGAVRFYVSCQTHVIPTAGLPR